MRKLAVLTLMILMAVPVAVAVNDSPPFPSTFEWGALE